MTVRNFGRQQVAIVSAAAAMIAAGPAAFGQDTSTPSRPIDFRLPPPGDDGRSPGVQGPADNGLPPVAPGERPGPQTAPAPPPTPPRVIPTQPAPATTTATPAPTQTRREAPANAVPRDPAAADRASAAEAVAQDSPALPPLQPGAPDIAAPTDTAPSVVAETPIPARPESASAGTPLWAWIVAVLAALGVGYWYWRSRTGSADPVANEVEDVPRPAAPTPAPRTVTPPPTPKPASAPAPAGSVLRDVPRPAAPLVTRAADEQRALVGMALEILSIRFAPDHVTVGFKLNLLNQGSAAATGLMVRIALNQGSAMPEAVLGRFFDGAGGSVLRDDMTLAPGAGEQLTSEAMLPRAAIDPLMIGGKPMLVPVMAFDVTYHWDGEGDAFGQNAGSFVLGREQGPSKSEKLAPLSLARASYAVDLPGARSTAVRRVQ